MEKEAETNGSSVSSVGTDCSFMRKVTGPISRVVA